MSLLGVLRCGLYIIFGIFPLDKPIFMLALHNEIYLLSFFILPLPHSSSSTPGSFIFRAFQNNRNLI